MVGCGGEGFAVFHEWEVTRGEGNGRMLQIPVETETARYYRQNRGKVPSRFELLLVSPLGGQSYYLGPREALLWHPCWASLPKKDSPP